MPTERSRRPRPAPAGFTLIELLAVILVIGILAGIVITSTAGVTNSAKRAKTKVQFSQWATALESFRQEYGYYPDFTTASGSTAFANGLIDDPQKTLRFVEALTGKKINGDPLDSPGPGLTSGNTKRIAFYSFGSDDLTNEGSPRLRDAFGNTEIVVLFDKNYDGLIKIAATGGDYSESQLQDVNTLDAPLVDGNTVRASVIFYSAGAGTSTADIVKSWE